MLGLAAKRLGVVALPSGAFDLAQLVALGEDRAAGVVQGNVGVERQLDAFLAVVAAALAEEFPLLLVPDR